MRVVLTYGPGRLEELEAALLARGDEVLRRPLIEVVPQRDPATRAAARRLLRLPWLLFPSRSAVEAWSGLGLPFPTAPHGPRLGAVGSGTAAALRSAGGRVDAIGEPANADGLATVFLARADAAGPVGLPRGARGRARLEMRLREAGLATEPVTLYATERRDWPGASDGVSADAIVIASPSAAEGLPDDLEPRATVIAIGPVTAATLRDRGFEPWIAARPEVGAILERIDEARAGVTPPTRADGRTS